MRSSFSERRCRPRCRSSAHAIGSSRARTMASASSRPTVCGSATFQRSGFSGCWPCARRTAAIVASTPGTPAARACRAAPARTPRRRWRGPRAPRDGCDGDAGTALVNVRVSTSVSLTTSLTASAAGGGTPIALKASVSMQSPRASCPGSTASSDRAPLVQMPSQSGCHHPPPKPE